MPFIPDTQQAGSFTPDQVSSPASSFVPDSQGGMDTNFLKEFSRGIPRGFLKVAEGLTGTIGSAVGLIPGLDSLEAGFERAEDNIESAAEKWAPQQGGFGAWAGSILGEALPYTASAMAGGAVAGLGGAAAVAFSVSGDEAYDNARDAGASEGKARAEQLIVGSLNAVIEAAQIGRIFKFGKAGKTSIKNMVRIARNKGVKAAMLAEGGKFTGEMARSAVENALEEMLQEGVTLAAPAILRDGGYPTKPDGSPDWLQMGERIAGAGMAGGFTGAVLGGGMSLTAAGELGAPSEAGLTQARDSINNSDMSAVEKAEMLEQLEGIAYEGKDDPDAVTREDVPDIEIPEATREVLDRARQVEELMVSSDFKGATKEEAKAISEERTKRFARYEARIKEIDDPVLAGRLARGSLAGQLKHTFTPLNEQINPEEFTSIWEAARSSSMMTGQMIHLDEMVVSFFV